MVNFECSHCIKTLKKKQVEPHYMYECRNSHNFCCLTCYQNFDRDTVKGHISCVTEEEKYTKGDNTKKANMINIAKAEVQKYNIEALEWAGFRNTSKKILMGHDNYKLPMKELFDKLSIVYANSKGVEKEDVCQDLVKKQTLKRLEKDNKFVLDLSKNTIRYKI